ncbi:MAG: XdhC family protein [Sulfurifustaceae bacterium]
MDNEAVLEKALQLKQAGMPFVLATVVQSRMPASAKAGAKAVIEPDGSIYGWIGGGCAQPAVIKVAKRTLKEGRPYLVRISPSGDEASVEGVVEYNMTCHSGGSLDIFVEPVLPRARLLIFGSSAFAQALADLAARAGFNVRVAAPGAERAEFASAECVFEDFASIDADCDFAVVATQGKRDEDALAAALGTSARYVTMVASRRKAGRLKQYLRERGHDPARIDAVVAPAGLDIGAVTPAEIAVSVLGALIQARRDAMKTTALEEKPDQVTCASPAIDPVCGMTVDRATATYTLAHAGVTYYFCCAGCRQEFEKAPTRYAA